MVKRILSLGCAIALAFSLSLTSFAAVSQSTVQMGFPYYSSVSILFGNSNAGFTSLASSRPITGSYGSMTTQSLTSRNVILNFILGQEYDLGVLDDDTLNFSYQVPVYSSVESTTHNVSNDWPVQGYTGSISDTDGDGEYYVDITTKYPDRYSLNSSNQTYSVSIPAGESVNLVNNSVDAGEYCISGYFDFNSADVSGLDLENMLSNPRARIRIGSNGEWVNSYDYDLECDIVQRNGLTTSDGVRYAYTLSFTVPSNIAILNASNKIAVQIRFDLSEEWTAYPFYAGVSTGGFRDFDNVTGFAGLSFKLDNFFSKIKNSIDSFGHKIVSRLDQRDNDAQNAVSDELSQDNQTSQEKIAAVESFEADLNSGINQGIEAIDLSPPTSSFTGAFNFCSFVVTETFNNLSFGGVNLQQIIIVPLILGVMLLLIGRGSMALGEMMSRVHLRRKGADE